MTVKQIQTKIARLEKQRAEMVEQHKSPIEIYPITIKLAHLYKMLNEAEGLAR